MSFFCSFCGNSFRSQGGLTKHVNSKHRKNSTLAGMAAALQSHTFIQHPHLSARPCLSDGAFLRDLSQPPTSELLESHGDPWLPFGDRLAYEWARYHYVKLQSSAADVQQGLDLWRATVMMYQADHDSCDGVPWKSAAEMYGTINAIPVGGVGWTTYQLSYSGPQPTGTLPQWMQETYELNVRDVLSVFEEQLASKEFDGEFEYTPYEEYNEKGSRVYSNLMSGIWAFREADTISQDKKMHGAMFVPIIAGSDKTTVSVATGHQEYHPVYLSGVVSTWCPKCDALPTDLDGSGPFTYSFHAPTSTNCLHTRLLHQLIKGVFRTTLVEWVLEYLHLEHGETAALDIIEDIDRRISAVPPFPGLRRFPDGRDYQQWTGDDSKALMKVFLAAIAGYVPSVMVRCIAAFMDACYIARKCHRLTIS
ncbi:hypothetical protein EDB84DRAFT_1591306 [Lactarius hengduanensis]|nr:hypothetical protein EDB84DRAFT_1591306 [Lactarius hengduanensis]